MKANKKTVTSNVLWRFFERTGAQGVNFIVSLILARLLEPKVYGVVALVTVFTAILQIFVNCGFSSALIQKKNPDSLDYSSVFYFNLLSCVVLYALLFGFAPLIAKFYEMPELTSIIRVMGITLLIGGINGMQHTYVSKNLMFKRFFFATLGGTIGAGVIGIWMAYRGYGVWALVASNLFNSAVDTIILWVTVKWRPTKEFSLNRLKALFSFGWKMLASNILDVVYDKIRQLIIGKMYSAEDLAFYNKGDTFPNMLISNIDTSLNSVLFPSMAAAQDNMESLKNMTRRSLKTSTYLIMPMMVGLAVCAEPVISIILTDKWLPCVPFLRIFCFTYAFYPVHTSNLNAIKASGRSDIFFKLEIIKKAVDLAAILSTMWFGVMAMAYSLLFTSIAGQIINSYPNKKLMKYSYLEQLKDMLPNIGLSLFMGAAVFSINFIQLNDILKLIIQVPLGMAIYFGLSKLFKIDSFEYVLGIAKSFIKKRNKKETAE